MKEGEARTLLEVGPDASADAVRRAYLRRIKKHKPESDPEGFQRTREAYEFLSALAAARAEPAPFTPSPPETEDGASPIADLSDEPPRAPREGPYREAPPARPDEADAVWQLLQWLEGEDDPEVRIERLEKAIVTHPQSAVLVRELEHELHAAERPEAAALALRKGIERGLSELEASLFQLHGERLTDEELERLRTCDRPGLDRPGLDRAYVYALLHRDQLEHALGVAAQAIAREPGSVIPWLSIVLAFYEKGRLASGRQIFDAVRAVIDARQEGARLPSASQLRLVSVSQLADVAPRLDIAVVVAMAQGLRSGHPADALPALEAYQRWSPSSAWNAATLLRTDARALAPHFADALAQEPERAAPPKKRVAGSWWMLFVVLGVLRVFASASRETHAPPSRGIAPAPVVYEVRSAAFAEPDTCAGDRGCGSLANASRAMDRGDCEVATAGLRSFDRVALEVEFSHTLALREQLQRRYESECSAEPEAEAAAEIEVEDPSEALPQEDEVSPSGGVIWLAPRPTEER